MAHVDLPTPDAYPGNSDKKRMNKQEEPKKEIKKVASATKRKKSMTKKFKEAFIGDDGDNQSVADYILYDVLVPAAKNTISDMVTGGIEMLLYGERRGSSRMNRDRGRSYVNYSGYSTRRDDDRVRNNSRVRRSARDRVYNDDIVVPTRGEAEQIIDSLLDIIDQYGSASIADLYSLTGIDSDFTDNSYGWTNLSTASVSRTRDGYILNLPRAYPID